MARSAPQATKQKSEWDSYTKLGEEPATTDLLQWWKNQEPDFPKLSKMARQVLGCQILSAGVERLFGKATRTYDKLRKMESVTLWDVLMATNVP